MARVTTRTGDEGFTDLLGSVRVPKYHRRPQAFGTVDEATSALGVARAHATDDELRSWLLDIQHDLYTLMAELATPPENHDKVDFVIRDSHVQKLDALSDRLKSQVEIGNRFIVPGDTVVGSFLDLARTIVRRAERQVARLYHDGDVRNAYLLQYLNRVSDVLFIIARYDEQHPSQPSAL